MKRIAPALALLLLAGCARSEEASLVPPDSNLGYNQVGSVSRPEEDDREQAIGEWRASLQENVQALEFGPVGTEPLFSILCASDDAILLQRHGGAPAGPLPPMEVTIGEVAQRLPVGVGGGTIPMLRSEVPLRGPLAEALTRGGQQLLVRVGDSAPLIMPASPLVADYLRSCATARPLATGPAAGASNLQTGNAAAPAANAAAPAPSAPTAGANTSQPKQP